MYVAWLTSWAKCHRRISSKARVSRMRIMRGKNRYIYIYFASVKKKRGKKIMIKNVTILLPQLVKPRIHWWEQVLGFVPSKNVLTENKSHSRRLIYKNKARNLFSVSALHMCMELSHSLFVSLSHSLDENLHIELRRTVSSTS